MSAGIGGRQALMACACVGENAGQKIHEQPPSSGSKLLNCIQYYMKPHPWALLIAKSFFFKIFFKLQNSTVGDI